MVVWGCIQGFASANINTLLKLLKSSKLLKRFAWVQTLIKVNKLLLGNGYIHQQKHCHNYTSHPKLSGFVFHWNLTAATAMSRGECHSHPLLSIQASSQGFLLLNPYFDFHLGGREHSLVKHLRRPFVGLTLVAPSQGIITWEASN